MKRWLSFLLCLTLCMAPFFARAEEDPLAAYDFTADQSDGETFTLSEHLGEVIVLDIWATWCPPCLKKLPVIDRLYAAYEGDPRVCVRAVNAGERPAQAKALMEENGYTVPAVYDKLNAASRRFGVTALPTTIVIAPDGAIADITVGAETDADAAFQKYADMIDSMLEK